MGSVGISISEWFFTGILGLQQWPARRPPESNEVTIEIGFKKNPLKFGMSLIHWFSLIFTFEVVAQKCNFRNFTKKCDIQWIGLGKSHDPILDKPWVMIQSGWISHSWMVDVQSKKKMESHSWKICQSTFKSTCQAKIHLFHLLSKKAEGRSQISWLKPFLPDSHRGWNPGRNNPRESENRVPQKIDDHHMQGEMAV